MNPAQAPPHTMQPAQSQVGVQELARAIMRSIPFSRITLSSGAYYALVKADWLTGNERDIIIDDRIQPRLFEAIK